MSDTGFIGHHPLYDIFCLIAVEYDKSVEKYGDWQGKSIDYKFNAIHREFVELMEAADIPVMDGPHGVIIEAVQLANCCCKLVLSERKGKQGKGE